ncbi:MAG: hypothetical protein ABIA93_01910 [Candidatus Woesearchaeota archaeon]
MALRNVFIDPDFQMQFTLISQIARELRKEYGIEDYRDVSPTQAERFVDEVLSVIPDAEDFSAGFQRETQGFESRLERTIQDFVRSFIVDVPKRDWTTWERSRCRTTENMNPFLRAGDYASVPCVQSHAYSFTDVSSLAVSPKSRKSHNIVNAARGRILAALEPAVPLHNSSDSVDAVCGRILKASEPTYGYVTDDEFRKRIRDRTIQIPGCSNAKNHQGTHRDQYILLARHSGHEVRALDQNQGVQELHGRVKGTRFGEKLVYSILFDEQIIDTMATRVIASDEIALLYALQALHESSKTQGFKNGLTGNVRIENFPLDSKVRRFYEKRFLLENQDWLCEDPENFPSNTGHVYEANHTTKAKPSLVRITLRRIEQGVDFTPVPIIYRVHLITGRAYRQLEESPDLRHDVYSERSSRFRKERWGLVGDMMHQQLLERGMNRFNDEFKFVTPALRRSRH